MNEIVRWYIEQAVIEFFEKNYAPSLSVYPVDAVLQNPGMYPEILLRALELAVKDVG